MITPCSVTHRLTIQCERSGVNGHADDRIYRLGVEGVDVGARRNAAGRAGAKERRGEDEGGGAGGGHLTRELEGSIPASDAAGQPRADGCGEIEVRSLAHGRIEIDELHFRKPLELADPGFGVGSLEG